MNYDPQKYRKKTGGKFRNLPSEAIVAWLERNFEVKPRKQGQEQRICNPFDHDSKFKFSINPEKGLCHCWTGDQWAGPINPKTGKRNCSFVHFVRLYKKCSYKEAISDIVGESSAGDYLKPADRVVDPALSNIIDVKLPKGLTPIHGSIDPLRGSVVKWLKSRGYTDETIADNDLQHIGFTVYWPYYEFDSLVYWQSRSRLNKRFNFPPTDHHSKDGKLVGKSDASKTDFVYGFDNVEPGTYVSIVEAIFDQNTLTKQALASGGAMLDDEQIKKIRILDPKDGIILAPDNDKAGLKSLLSNAEKLKRAGFPIYYSLPPEITFTTDDGSTKHTSDWNELFTDVGLSLKEIRRTHDNNIKLANSKNLISIRKKVHDLEKYSSKRR